MSLIHKALKKAQTPEEEKKVVLPTEEFVGEKPKSQFTPRTFVLIGLMILSLVFTIYKRLYKKSAPPPQPMAPIAAVAQENLQTPQPAPDGTIETPTLDPATAGIVEEGKKLFVAGKYDDAMARFLAAKQTSPSDPEILNNIGLIHKKKNNLEAAEAAYKEALAIKKDYPECLNNLGVLMAAKGDVLSAAIHLKKAIELQNTYADAYFNLAVLNEGEGNYREAISNYKSFLQYTDAGDETLIEKVKARVEELSE